MGLYISCQECLAYVSSRSTVCCVSKMGEYLPTVELKYLVRYVVPFF